MSAKKSFTQTLVWILMAMLILGLGGFGVTNLGGSVQSIGAVGDTEIEVDDYARALQNDLRAIEAQTGQPMSLAQAREMGIDQAVLRQVVTTAALDEEARLVGLSIGDENLLQQIRDIPAFQGINGGFDREAYRYALQNAGVSEADFEADLRSETARTLLQGAVVAGVQMPEAYTALIANFVGERRAIEWAKLDRTDLISAIPEPTQNDLVTWHAENIADYTRPEIKDITYVWLTPEMMIDTVKLEDGALQAAYDARAEEYNRPERRLVERLAFGDESEAQAAAEAVASGETDFTDLVAERGLDLADIDLGDVTEADLDAAGAAVFTAQVGDVVGPLQSTVGPALFRVNGILPAQNTPFEEVRDELRRELARDRARRLVEGRIEAVDNLLVGGASLEEVAEETQMELATLGWHPDAAADINGYTSFRATAEAVQEGDYPKVVELQDGGFFALRLDGVTPPEAQPFAEVQEQVRVDWRENAALEALRAQVEAQVPALQSGAAMGALGVEVQLEEGLTRGDFIPGAPEGFIETVFRTGQGDVAVIEGAGNLFVARVNDILAPNEDDAEVRAVAERLSEQSAAGIGQDLFTLLAEDIRTRAGLSLDQAAINAVHANFQ